MKLSTKSWVFKIATFGTNTYEKRRMMLEGISLCPLVWLFIGKCLLILILTFVGFLLSFGIGHLILKSALSLPLFANTFATVATLTVSGALAIAAIVGLVIASSYGFFKLYEYVDEKDWYEKLKNKFEFEPPLTGQELEDAPVTVRTIFPKMWHYKSKYFCPHVTIGE